MIILKDPENTTGNIGQMLLSISFCILTDAFKKGKSNIPTPSLFTTGPVKQSKLHYFINPLAGAIKNRLSERVGIIKHDPAGIYFLVKAKSTQLFPQVGVSNVVFSAAKRAAALSTSF